MDPQRDPGRSPRGSRGGGRRSRRGLGDDQPAAEFEQGSGTLGHHGGPAERTGQDPVEGASGVRDRGPLSLPGPGAPTPGPRGPGAGATSLRKAVRRAWASRRTRVASGQRVATTRPGSPPPEPRSRRTGGAGPSGHRRRQTATKPSAWWSWASSGPGTEEAGGSGLLEDWRRRGGGGGEGRRKGRCGAPTGVRTPGR